jgi:hypothetical protein
MSNLLITEEIITGQKTLQVKIPPGQSSEMYPQTSYAPKMTAYWSYKYANFSALVKCSEAGKIKLTSSFW